jgi:site-specific DNA-methyltransferase (adenine-specific)
LENTLYLGDNLDILRRYVADDSVDLIYLDPPFKSNQDYNLLFKERDGSRSQGQIRAFGDTWTWSTESEAAYETMLSAGGMLAQAIYALRQLLGQSDMMAYLVMMAPRLLEMQRKLKARGSLYLHCDTAAGHYLKILMDGVFGPDHFRGQIVWKRTSSHGNVSTRFGDVTDFLLYYAKGDRPIWNQQYVPYTKKHIKTKFTGIDRDGRRFTTSDLRNPSPRPNLRYEYKGYKSHPNGWAVSQAKMEAYDRAGRLVFPASKDGRIRLKRYLDEQRGQRLQNLWDDISPVNSRAAERVGYPTQKPEALLERIILTSSSEGDVVLDPFAGCGTAVVTAQRLKRAWIGIDITEQAITEVRKRLDKLSAKYGIVREPKSVADALALAKTDPHHFQTWALDLLGIRPTHPRKGRDGTMDAKIVDRHGRSAVISVKSGQPKLMHVHELQAIVQRERATIGALVAMYEPTPTMKKDAATTGIYQVPGRIVPRLQLLTIAQIFAGGGLRWPDPDVPLSRASLPRGPHRQQYRLPLTAQPASAESATTESRPASRRGQPLLPAVEQAVPWGLMPASLPRRPARAPSRRTARSAARRRRAG